MRRSGSPGSRFLSRLLPLLGLVALLGLAAPAGAQNVGTAPAPGAPVRLWPPGLSAPAWRSPMRASGPGPAPTVAGALSGAPRVPPVAVGDDVLQVEEPARSGAFLALGGALGGFAGFWGGAFLGAWIATETADPGAELAALGGATLGGAAGEVVGVALGVHRADGGRGSFWRDLGASALAGAGIVAGAAAIDVDGGPAWTLLGLGVGLQIGLTVRTEIGSR